MAAVTTDVYEGTFWQDPYRTWTELREAAPVHRLERPTGPVWLISRYADVHAALSDSRLSRDSRWSLPPELRAGAPSTQIPMMILKDPPEHTRLRRLVTRTFTTRRMEALRPRIQEFTRDLIAALPEHGQVDIMESYASVLPVLVIAELLGVPAEDRATFSAWSSTIVDVSTLAESQQAQMELGGYLSGLIETKREHPDDALIGALMTDVDDDKLSHVELVAMSMMLLIAGHETTVNLISSGLLALLTHPEQFTRLRENPDLMPAAVEEFLRWESPIHTATSFYTTEDVEYSGVTIPAGSEVLLCLAAANRDPQRFPGADELRLERDTAGQLAFSRGLHHCLGAQLARIEGQEALQALITARPDMRLAVDPDEVTWRRSNIARGLTTLPVLLGD